MIHVAPSVYPTAIQHIRLGNWKFEQQQIYKPAPRFFRGSWGRTRSFLDSNTCPTISNIGINSKSKTIYQYNTKRYQQQWNRKYQSKIGPFHTLQSPRYVFHPQATTCIIQITCNLGLHKGSPQWQGSAVPSTLIVLGGNLLGGTLSELGLARSLGLIVPPRTNALPPGTSSALKDSTNSSYSRAASSSALCNKFS